MNKTTFLNSTKWLVVTLTLALSLASISAYAVEKVTYYHTDALGSPVAGTDAAGNMLWKEDYRLYGERLRKQTESATNSRWYTGHVEDKETGLIYAGARHYDPVLGRFLAIDPVGFSEGNIQGFNRYAYANNNPYTYVDPDGNESEIANGNILDVDEGSQYIDSLSEGGGIRPDFLDFELEGGIPTSSGAIGLVKSLTNLGLKNLAKGANILRKAAQGKGNFGLGTSSSSEAAKLGNAWVGDGFKIASDGKTLVSKDGLRQYRPPTYKPKLGKTQANFEQKFPGQKSKGFQSNGHLDIKD